MPELESKWKPSPEIKTHRGDAIPSDLVFFTPPPQDLVNLRSAASNVKNGKVIQARNSMGLGLKIVCGTFLGFIGGLIACIPVALIFKYDTLIWIASLIVAVAIFVVILLMDFSTPATCNYVADNGITTNLFKKKPNLQKGIGLFLFHQADELRVVKSQLFTNGAYTKTNYIFEWQKANGETIFNLKGQYHSREDNPPPLDLYYFALAAEKTWSLFKFELIHQELKENGQVIFKLGNNDAIIIAQGYVELIQKGQSSRLDGNEIKQISLSGGVIQIIPKEVKSSGFLGFGSDGIWRIPYGAIANAKIFMLIFDMLINQK